MGDHPKLLLCTDLDRTLLPNGAQEESVRARDYFRALANHPLITIAYVSGRNIALVKEAIEQYKLPLPDFAITDVGVNIYMQQAGEYYPMEQWQTFIGQSWPRMTASILAKRLGGFAKLALQPESNQAPYKLSYQVSPSHFLNKEIEVLHQRLDKLSINTCVVVSIDETQDIGLVDVLPQLANKKQAIDHLVQYLDYSSNNVIFSGDSGNDLDVLVSSYPSVLVNNSTVQVKDQAAQMCARQGGRQYFYQAQGLPELGLNGNYSAGLIEGLLHFHPHFKAWLQTEV